jgi:hypothetical protein
MCDDGGEGCGRVVVLDGETSPRKELQYEMELAIKNGLGVFCELGNIF